MKKQLILAAAVSSLLAVTPVGAQTVVSETTTTAEPVEVVGTVTTRSPDAVVVRTKEAAEPVRYAFTKTTEYVDEAGNRVEASIVKTGVPVSIRYVKEGDRM